MSSRRVSGATSIVLMALAVAAPAAAQDNPSPDFFFGAPRGSIGIRGAWVFARADSDLFDFVQRTLTIDKSDFNTPAIGLDVTVVLTPRIEAIANFEFSSASTSSEYRDLVDDKFLPITQDTALKEAEISGGLKMALLPRGRRISRLAWIPRGLTPYIGGGAGVVRYRFTQSGDFVDYVDYSVFTDVIQSIGWTPGAHVFGGVDVQLYKGLFLSLDGRYVWAAGKLGRDFIGFDPIDLSGFRPSAGARLVF